MEIKNYKESYENKVSEIYKDLKGIANYDILMALSATTAVAGEVLTTIGVVTDTKEAIIGGLIGVGMGIWGLVYGHKKANQKDELVTSKVSELETVVLDEEELDYLNLI